MPSLDALLLGWGEAGIRFSAGAAMPVGAGVVDRPQPPAMPAAANRSKHKKLKRGKRNTGSKLYAGVQVKLAKSTQGAKKLKRQLNKKLHD